MNSSTNNKKKNPKPLKKVKKSRYHKSRYLYAKLTNAFCRNTSTSDPPLSDKEKNIMFTLHDRVSQRVLDKFEVFKKGDVFSKKQKCSVSKTNVVMGKKSNEFVVKTYNIAGIRLDVVLSRSRHVMIWFTKSLTTFITIPDITKDKFPTSFALDNYLIQ